MDLPLLASLDQSAMDHAQGREFIDWFSAAHVRPSMRADPATGDAAVAQLATIVDSFLSQRTESDEEPPDRVADEVGRFLIRQVDAFLATLPDGWADRVAERHGIAERLRRQTVMVLTFGDGREARVTALAKAYAAAKSAAAAGGQPSAELALIDGARATLEVDSSDATPPSATLSSADARVSLAPHVIALLEEDEAIRTDALPSLAYLIDPPS